VLVHERTHVARADWAIAVLAGINRCVFWFHPLAWWLERQLSLLAELACDDASLAGVASRAAYAEVLVEMAEAVRRGGGRVNWEAMAMARHSEVRVRVERILDESRQILPALTRARWIALLGCALPLVYLAAAARPARVRAQAAAPAPQTASAPAQESSSAAELAAARQRIEQLEAELANFKGRNRDQQEDFAANAAQMNAFQVMLAGAQTALSRLQEQKLMLETQLQNNNNSLRQFRLLGDEELTAERRGYLNGLIQRMLAMQAEISAITEQLNPNHPTVKKAQAALEALERRRNEFESQNPRGDSSAARDLESSNNLLKTEIQNLDLQLEEKAKQMRDLERQLESSRRRVESTPRTEGTIAGLLLRAQEAYRQAKEDANPRAQLPELIFKRAPEYSTEARKARMQGRVELDIVIKEGKATEIKVARGLGLGLDEKAIECVKSWRWQNDPVSHATTVAVIFQLPVQK